MRKSRRRVASAIEGQCRCKRSDIVCTISRWRRGITSEKPLSLGGIVDSEKECGLTRTLRAAYAELTRISGVNLCPILTYNPQSQKALKEEVLAEGTPKVNFAERSLTMPRIHAPRRRVIITSQNFQPHWTSSSYWFSSRILASKLTGDAFAPGHLAFPYQSGWRYATQAQ